MDLYYSHGLPYFFFPLHFLVLSNSHNLLQSGQISEESSYRRKALLFSFALFNLEWLIQHIRDATVLVANEELASNYGKSLPCFRDWER